MVKTRRSFESHGAAVNSARQRVSSSSVTCFVSLMVAKLIFKREHSVGLPKGARGDACPSGDGHGAEPEAAKHPIHGYE